MAPTTSQTAVSTNPVQSVDAQKTSCSSTQPLLTTAVQPSLPQAASAQMPPPSTTTSATIISLAATPTSVQSGNPTPATTSATSIPLVATPISVQSGNPPPATTSATSIPLVATPTSVQSGNIPPTTAPAPDVLPPPLPPASTSATTISTESGIPPQTTDPAHVVATHTTGPSTMPIASDVITATSSQMGTTSAPIVTTAPTTLTCCPSTSTTTTTTTISAPISMAAQGPTAGSSKSSQPVGVKERKKYLKFLRAQGNFTDEMQDLSDANSSDEDWAVSHAKELLKYGKRRATGGSSSDSDSAPPRKRIKGKHLPKKSTSISRPNPGMSLVQVLIFFVISYSFLLIDGGYDSLLNAR
jgi:hypothetical protein